MNAKKKMRNDIAAKMMKAPERPLLPIDLSEEPYATTAPKGMTRAFANNRYTVMVYDNTETSHGLATKALIQNHFNQPIHNHWSELNRIKNEIFGEETVAVEYYPAKSKLIDQHNIYWIWIYPEGVLPIPTM